jgi:hypothetical protein
MQLLFRCVALSEVIWVRILFVIENDREPGTRTETNNAGVLYSVPRLLTVPCTNSAEVLRGHWLGTPKYCSSGN